MNEGRGREEHEILCSKRALKSEVNIQMIKVEKMRTHDLYLEPKCHTKLEENLTFY